MPHDEITKDPRTRAALTGLPLADVIEDEQCERCKKRAPGIRTYHVEGRTVRLCRPCSDAAAYEQAERSRAAWIEATVQAAFAEAMENGQGGGGARLTPDDFAPGADAYDRWADV